MHPNDNLQPRQNIRHTLNPHLHPRSLPNLQKTAQHLFFFQPQNRAINLPPNVWNLQHDQPNSFKNNKWRIPQTPRLYQIPKQHRRFHQRLPFKNPNLFQKVRSHQHKPLGIRVFKRHIISSKSPPHFWYQLTHVYAAFFFNMDWDARKIAIFLLDFFLWIMILWICLREFELLKGYFFFYFFEIFSYFPLIFP